jgi:hypothetical protein
MNISVTQRSSWVWASAAMIMGAIIAISTHPIDWFGFCNQLDASSFIFNSRFDSGEGGKAEEAGSFWPASPELLHTSFKMFVEN